MKPVHPTLERAIKIACYTLQASYPSLQSPSEQVLPFKNCGFSAGSCTGLALRKVFCTQGKFAGHRRLAAIAMPTPHLQFTHHRWSVTFIQCLEDKLCVWRSGTEDVLIIIMCFCWKASVAGEALMRTATY